MKNKKTNKTEEIIIRGSDIPTDEDKTWFYLECEFIDDNN